MKKRKANRAGRAGTRYRSAWRRSRRVDEEEDEEEGSGRRTVREKAGATSVVVATELRQGNTACKA